MMEYNAGSIVEYDGPDQNASLVKGDKLLVLSTRDKRHLMVQVQSGSLKGHILYITYGDVRSVL